LHTSNNHNAHSIMMYTHGHHQNRLLLSRHFNKPTRRYASPKKYTIFNQRVGDTGLSISKMTKKKRDSYIYFV